MLRSRSQMLRSLVLLLFFAALVVIPADVNLPGEHNARPVSPRSARQFTDLRLRMIELDSDLLRSHVRESLNAELAPIFAELNGRVPDVVEWAFRWRTSYALLRRGVVAVLNSPFDNPLNVWRDQTSAAVKEKFAELVLHGDDTAWRINMARQHWLSQARTTVDGVFAWHNQGGAAIGAPHAQSVYRVQEFKGSTPDEAQISAQRIRAFRPIAVRMAIRLPSAIPVAATAAATDIAFITGAAGFAVSIASTLTVDFLVSRADAKINQDKWESEIRLGLETWRQDLNSHLMTEINDYIDDHQRRAVASLPLASPVGRRPLAKPMVCITYFAQFDREL